MPPRKRRAQADLPAPEAKRPATRAAPKATRSTRKESSAAATSRVQVAGCNGSKWQPPKTKRTKLEASIGFVGAVVPAKLKYGADKSTERGMKAIRSGATASPCYDRLGYQLNYKALKRAQTRLSGGRMSLRAIMNEIEADKRKKTIMGRSHEWGIGSWEDRIARDLDIPYHTVKMPEFEEWHRRGFKLEPGELEERPSEEENERLSALAVGSAFRE